MLVVDWFGHVEGMWEWPPYAHALRRIASFAELAMFDKRGVGLSDPLPTAGLPNLEDWMQDVGAVMDAVGFDGCTLMGVGSGGPMSMCYAANHPERVHRLVLVNSYARLLRAPDYGPGFPERVRDAVLAAAYTDDGQAQILGGAHEPDFVRWWTRYQRNAVSPSTAAAMRRMMFEVDVRAVLPSIQAPTLVLHREHDAWIQIDHGRYLSEHIEGASFIQLPGSEDLFFQGDSDVLLDHVERFVAGPTHTIQLDRVLATMLFTDMVGSTDLLARLGDTRWRTLLDDHDAIVRRQIGAHGGRLVGTSGDGLLALFDSPGRAISAAAAMRDELRSIGLHIRSGIHTGEIERRGADVGGIAVHLAARVMSAAGRGEILVTRTVKDLVAGSGWVFVDRGVHVLKGIPDPWALFEVAT